MAYEKCSVLDRKRQVEGYRHVAMCALVRDRDMREAKGAWCPGKYFGKCSNCGRVYIGAKHSLICADCAYGTVPRKQLTYREIEEQRIRSEISTYYLS